MFFSLRKNELIYYSYDRIQDGPFRGCSRMGKGGEGAVKIPKICYTYPTMIKLGTAIPYLKKTQKSI